MSLSCKNFYQLWILPLFATCGCGVEFAGSPLEELGPPSQHHRGFVVFRFCLCFWRFAAHEPPLRHTWTRQFVIFGVACHGVLTPQLTPSRADEGCLIKHQHSRPNRRHSPPFNRPKRPPNPSPPPFYKSHAHLFMNSCNHLPISPQTTQLRGNCPSSVFREPVGGRRGRKKKYFRQAQRKETKPGCV